MTMSDNDPWGTNYGPAPEPLPAPRSSPLRNALAYVPAVPAAAVALGLSAFIGLFDNWLITLIALAGLVAVTMGRK